MGGFCLQQSSRADHCGVLLHSNPLQKHLCRESSERDKGPDGNGGWVQNYQRAGCGLGLTSRQPKPPVSQRPPSVPWIPKGPRRKRGKWRARPLDHTGKAFFLSSGGSGMSPSWRQDASGPQRKSSPCRNQMGGRKDQGDSNHPEPLDPDDSSFG